MLNAFITGEKIYLRPFCEDDINKWYLWFNDEEVTKYSYHGVFPATYHTQKEFFCKLYSDKTNLQLAIVTKKNNILIGTVGLHQINFLHQRADISIIIGEKNYWNKGYATDAVKILIKHGFNKMNLHRITAGVVEENIASLNLFLKLGFKKEGILREHKFANNKFSNVIQLGLIKKEFIY